MINESQLGLISQLTNSLLELESRLEEAYLKKDSRSMELIKNEILNFQRKIAEELEKK